MDIISQKPARVLNILISSTVISRWNGIGAGAVRATCAGAARSMVVAVMLLLLLGTCLR